MYLYKHCKILFDFIVDKTFIHINIYIFNPTSSNLIQKPTHKHTHTYRKQNNHNYKVPLGIINKYNSNNRI